VKSILSRAEGGVLERFARSNTLLAFDFDGTLAPIVADRAEARIEPSTRELLRRVCERYPTAVISGRSRNDLQARLAGAGVRHVVGNHGLEPAADMPAFERATARIRPLLARLLASQRGVEIEDKRYSLALHYRGAAIKRAAREAILRAIATLPSSPRVLAGKEVVNLLPEAAPHKGIALQQLLASEDADTAIYVGDDETDEDVFALEEEPGRLLAIRVGWSRASAAPFFIRNQRAIDALLERLLELRAAPRSRDA
jgi:trehalose 6-phosphate phosphatase